MSDMINGIAIEENKPVAAELLALVHPRIRAAIEAPVEGSGTAFAILDVSLKGANGTQPQTIEVKYGTSDRFIVALALTMQADMLDLRQLEHIAVSKATMARTAAFYRSAGPAGTDERPHGYATRLRSAAPG